MDHNHQPDQLPQHPLPGNANNELDAVGDMFGWYSGNDADPSHDASHASSPNAMPNHPSMSALSPINTSLMQSIGTLHTASDPSTPNFQGWTTPFDLSPDSHRLASHILHYHDPENTQDHRRPCIADNPSMVFSNCGLPRIGEHTAPSDTSSFFANLTYDCDFVVDNPLDFAQHVFQEHRPALMIQDPYVPGFSNNGMANHLASFIPSMPELPGPAYDYHTMPEPGRCHSLPGSYATDFSFQNSIPGTPLRAASPSELDCNCPDMDCAPDCTLDCGPGDLAKQIDKELEAAKPVTDNFVCRWKCEHGHNEDGCGKTFPNAAALHEHCKDAHTKCALKEDSQYWCKWDGCHRQEGFTQRAKLERHLQTHSGYKPSQCNICHQWFSARQALDQHMRTHTGVTPWKCDWKDCGKVFKQQSALTMHMRTHTGEKPLTCDVCGKTFSESSNLSKHKRTHNLKGLHKCDLCGRDFHRRDQLRRHMKSTHKDQMEKVEELLARPVEKHGGRKGRSGVMKQHARTPSLSISQADSPSLSPSLRSTPPDSVLDSIGHDSTILGIDETLPSSMMHGGIALEGMS